VYGNSAANKHIAGSPVAQPISPKERESVFIYRFDEIVRNAVGLGVIDLSAEFMLFAGEK
jgi:hypothetical protein